MTESAPLPYVYSFEEIGPELDLLPLAARRALDTAGLRLPLGGWRSIGVEDRTRLSLAGAAERVDTAVVSAIVATASPPAAPIDAAADPDPRAPPAELVASLLPARSLGQDAWARLRPLDRFALVHAQRRARTRGDPSILEAAFDAIASLPAAASADVPGVADTRSVSSHLDPRSGDVRMVDVGDKVPSLRRAVASGAVRMRPETAQRIVRADAPKGEVLATARIAGIMAAKRTPELIPLCHAVAVTHVAVRIDVDAEASEARVTAVAEARDRTGVEMEAMVAASVACLTIYDMLKGVDREMVISEIKLIEKSGGRSGHFKRGGGPA